MPRMLTTNWHGTHKTEESLNYKGRLKAHSLIEMVNNTLLL